MTASMSPLPEELDMLAAEFALGTAQGGDLARAEALMESADDFRARVAHWRGHFLALDDTAEKIAPPAPMWDAIDAAVASAPQQRALKENSRKRPDKQAAWTSLMFWRSFGLASAFASVLLGIGLMSLIARGPESPTYVAVLNTGEGRAAAVVNAYANGTVELIPLEQIQVPDNRIIEVWTLQNREQGPVSIGRLNQARRLKLDLKNLQRPDANHLFELTLEPQGGSPTGKPTGPVLMKGLAAKSI